MYFLALTCLLALAGQVYMATVPANRVEILFYVDPAVTQKYTDLGEGDAATVKGKIQTDADYFISEVNKIYEGAQGLSITIEKRALVILEEDILSDLVKDGTVERFDGLQKFDEWRKAQGAFDTYNQDIALLWTGYDLVNNGDPSTAGFANVGKVCDGEYASIIAEFTLTYNTVVVAAHETGHVLGSSHDTNSLHEVMDATTMASAENRWNMSTESVNSITTTIGALSENCLLTTSPESKVEVVSSPAELTNPDNICIRSRNMKDSFMIKLKEYYNGAAPHGDSICRAIYCFGGSADEGYPAYASSGMMCDKGKRCAEGKCVEAADADASSTDDCVSGDQERLLVSSVFDGTCGQLVDQYGKYVCYGYEAACCTTCGAIKTDDADCAYGDRSASCKGKDASSICFSEKNIATCCELCEGHTAKRSVGDDNSTVIEDLDFPQVQAKIIDPEDDMM